MNCPMMETKEKYCAAVLPDGCPLKEVLLKCPSNKLKPANFDYGLFVDPRDGKVYKTVKIGNQTWLAENLKIAYKGSKCYNDDLANESIYGMLYDWETAMRVCPPGWHLPTRKEWDTLINTVGNEKLAGKKLKANNGWNNNGNGTDEFGFSALPGGSGHSDGSFYNVGYLGYWWSATEDDDDSAHYRHMYYSNATADSSYSHKSCLFSVRCLQD